jgi:hypothetical protein
MPVAVESKRNYDFLLAEEGESREIIIGPPRSMRPGQLLNAFGLEALIPVEIAAILLKSTTDTGLLQENLVIARNAEVNDGYLVYGAMNPAAVNARLAQLGIIARPAPLPPSGFMALDGGDNGDGGNALAIVRTPLPGALGSGFGLQLQLFGRAVGIWFGWKRRQPP